MPPTSHRLDADAVSGFQQLYSRMSLRFLTINGANDGSLSKEIGRDTHSADASQLAVRMNSAMRHWILVGKSCTSGDHPGQVSGMTRAPRIGCISTVNNVPLVRAWRPA
jgi:hypothetical protein